MRFKPFLLFFPALLALVADSGESRADQPESVVETADEIEARADGRPSLVIYSSVDGGPWRSSRAVFPLSRQDVGLKVKTKNATGIRWYMIFADLTRNYKNANHPWEDNAYKWTGFEKIEYYRIELFRFRDMSEIRPFANDADLWEDVRRWFEKNGQGGRALNFYKTGVGTFWFQVEVDKKNGATLRSHGIEDSTEKGLSHKVMRVSLREDEGYLGYVTSFYNVPGVFGSVLYQSKNYIGADCADLLMSAWSKWKNSSLNKNFNVQMLLSKFPKVAEFQMSGGSPDQEIKWGDQIQPGDFIAVRYGDTGKRFHHVGALYRDANHNGVLDGDDISIHAGPDPLHLSYLKSGVFDGHVVILRPR